MVHIFRPNFVAIIIAVIFVFTPQMFSQQWNEPYPLSSLNTPSDDFAPSWNHHDSTIVFNSTFSGKSRFYYVRQLIDKPKLLPFLSNDSVQRGSSGSYASFSGGNLCVYSKFKKGKRNVVLNLVECTLTNGVWGTSEFLPQCSSEYFSSHPTISPLGNTLIFSTNRIGGEGKCDLWMCTKSNGIWNKPITMGESINSSGNEITPFMASEDTLYFSSDGYGGRGGYEIYMSVNVAGEWQQPLPVAELNTNYDESDFTILPNGVAIFASNRLGGKGNIDLYATSRFIGTNESTKNTIECTISLQQPEVVVERKGIVALRSIQPILQFSEEFPLEFNTKGAEKQWDITTNEELNLIANTIKLNQIQSCTIITYSHSDETSKVTAKQRIELLIDHLSKQYGVNPKIFTVAIQTNLTSQSQLNNVEFIINNKQVWKAIEFKTQTNIVQPQELVSILDIRPRDKVKSWEISLRCGLVNERINGGDKTLLPTPLRFSLAKYADSFSNEDSLGLHVKVIETNGEITTYVQHIPIRQRATKFQTQDTLTLIDCILYGNQILRYDKSGTYNSLIELVKSYNPNSITCQIQHNEKNTNHDCIQALIKAISIPVTIVNISPEDSLNKQQSSNTFRFVVKQK